jgi:hypothetical protein
MGGRERGKKWERGELDGSTPTPRRRASWQSSADLGQLLAAPASRCSVGAAWAQRSLGQRQQIGRRELAPARRAPLVVVVRHQQLVAERQHGGALREGRHHAEVAWDLGEPGDRKGDPRVHLESELVDEKTVSADVSLVKDQAGS